MSEKYNIQNTKEALTFGFAMMGALKAAKADDGKITFADAGHLMMVWPTIGPMVDDIKLIPKEIGDLDESELKELKDYAAAQLSLHVGDPTLVKKINAGLNLALAVGENWALYSADDESVEGGEQPEDGEQPE